MKSLSNIGFGIFLLVLLPVVGIFLILTGLLNLETGSESNDQVAQFSHESLYADAAVGKKFKSTGDATTASGPTASSYWIEFSFKDIKGRIVKSDTIVDESTYNQFDVNDHLTVKYLKNNPGIFKIVNESDTIGALVPKIFIFIGAIAFLTPFLYLYFGARLKRKTPT